MALVVQKAFITWRAVAVGQDGPDGDTDPDQIPLAGVRVRLTPSPRKVEVAAAGAEPARTVTLREWELITDATGNLINPDSPAAPIAIVASDAFPGVAVEWTSTISAPDSGVPDIAKRWAAPTGATVDLSTVASIPPAPSPLPDYLAAVAEARSARDVSIAAADRAETAQHWAETARTGAETARAGAEAAAETATAPTDAMVAGLIGSQSATRAAADSRYTQGRVRPGGGAGTLSGSQLIIGPEGAMPARLGVSGIIGGGAAGYENVIGGLVANVDTAASNIPPEGAGAGVGAMPGNNGNWSWIWGGYDNVVNGWACQVHGYHIAVETDANHCTVSGGSKHAVGTSAAYSTIGGGVGHAISAASNGATIGGGNGNIAGSTNTTIGGGIGNTATGPTATIGGGSGNVAAESATVAGGLTNSAPGLASSVPGGMQNAAEGRFSTATGRESVARLEGEHAHAAGRFTSLGDAQVRRFVARRLTTTATPSDLALDGSARFPEIPAGATWTFRVDVTAASVDGTASAGYSVQGVIARRAATAFVGTPTVTTLGETTPAWGVAVAAGSAGLLRIVVTGEADRSIRWVAAIEAVEIILPA